MVTDTDSDGLNDGEESLLDTNRTSSDTDGDGLTDFDEVWATIPTSKLMALHLDFGQGRCRVVGDTYYHHQSGREKQGGGN